MQTLSEPVTCRGEKVQGIFVLRLMQVCTLTVGQRIIRVNHIPLYSIFSPCSPEELVIQESK